MDKKPSMPIKWEWIAPFFPALLGVVIVTVLDALGIIKFNFSIHVVGSLIIMTGLMGTIILASILLSREAVKQMQRVSLRQARQEDAVERNRFLRRLDHELKNPLTGINLAMTNMAAAEDADTRQRLLQQIQTELTRLNHIVVDLRKIASVSGQPLEMSVVDLTALLQEVYAQAHEESPANEHNLQVALPDPPKSLSKIMGDQDLLLVAFYNLVNNALKYTRASDTITLRAAVEEEMVVIEVCDTGMGIDPAELPYIWDELYRSEQVRHIPGSGIGLALVKVIIERHGGSIEVQSQLQHGTTMRVYLPTLSLA